jgi:hypothetical protein
MADQAPARFNASFDYDFKAELYRAVFLPIRLHRDWSKRLIFGSFNCRTVLSVDLAEPTLLPKRPHLVWLRNSDSPLAPSSDGSGHCRLPCGECDFHRPAVGRIGRYCGPVNRFAQHRAK